MDKNSNSIPSLIEEAQVYLQNGNYDKLSDVSNKILKQDNTRYEGWAFLATAEASKVEKLIDANDFRDNAIYEQIDTYFENAYKFSTTQNSELRKRHIQFLKKNVCHARDVEIEDALDIIDELTESLENPTSTSPLCKVPKQTRKDYIVKFGEYIEERKRTRDYLQTLTDDQIIKVAQSQMDKYNTQSQQH